VRLTFFGFICIFFLKKHSTMVYPLNFAGFSNLTSLSIKKCASVTADGAKASADIANLVNFDLDRCQEIHGGFVHLKGVVFYLN
jgi:hypothetical protein